jgi:endonuclease/exonuclease/phosphatase family metal-dependent hydrolase
MSCHAVFFATLLSLVAFSTSLSVLSFNVQACTGLDKKYDIHRTAATINAIKPLPDLVGLQEIDNMTARHRGDDQLKILSKLTGMKYYTFGKVMDYQHGGYGIGILSRIHIVERKFFIYSTITDEPRVSCTHLLLLKIRAFWQ